MNSPLKERILSDIRAGKVAMRPKLVYAAQLTALSVTAFLILATTVFIANFVFFSIRIASHEALLGFGVGGVGAFLWHFPWFLAILNGALVVLFQWLFRKFEFGYKLPIVYTVAVLVMCAGLLGFAIDRGTPFNDRAFEGRAHLPPPMRAMYAGAGKPFPKGSGICTCTVLSVTGDTVAVVDMRDGTTTLTVHIAGDARHATTTGLVPGDVVLIAGREAGGFIEAFGIKKLRATMVP